LSLRATVHRREQDVADLVEALLARPRLLELVELAAHRLVGTWSKSKPVDAARRWTLRA
jgi:hypothetical protein